MRYYPSFNDMFDDLFDTESKNPTKANTMLCDIRETENTYEMNIALPGYKKEDISLDLTDGYLTVQPILIRIKKKKIRTVRLSEVNVIQEAVQESSMLVRVIKKKTSLLSLRMVN